jgi:hypothetical protein
LFILLISTPYWTRTSDLKVRNFLLYPSELRAHEKWSGYGFLPLLFLP